MTLSLRSLKLERPTFKHKELAFQELECVTTDAGRWYTTPDGFKYHSVTTFLGKTSDHGWLDEWRERLGAEAASAETQRCAVRGEAVHKACEDYLNNLPDFELSAGIHRSLFNQIRPYLNSVTEVYAIEIPLFSRMLRLAGRVDLIAVWKGELCIIDYKTSNQIKCKEHIEDYGLQLLCYSLMFEEMFGIRIDRLVNIIATEKSPRASVIEFRRKELLPKLAARVKQFRKQLEEAA